jgi:transposase
MDKAPTFVGVDVAEHRLDVHLRPSGEHFAVGHDEEGVAALVARLVALAPALVVLEATGGLEVAPRRPWPRPGCRSRSSTRAGCAPSRVPRGGWRGPTASTRRRSPASPRRSGRRYAPCPTRRRQLLEMLVAERDRRHAADPSLHEGIGAHLRRLGEALAMIERDLDTAVREGAVWRAREELLRSVPGVGPVSARTPLAELPELGSLTRR